MRKNTLLWESILILKLFYFFSLFFFVYVWKVNSQQTKKCKKKYKNFLISTLDKFPPKLQEIF